MKPGWKGIYSIRNLNHVFGEGTSDEPCFLKNRSEVFGPKMKRTINRNLTAVDRDQFKASIETKSLLQSA